MTHCNSILELKQKAFRMGICDRYRKEWEQVTNRKELADMMLSIQGADFVCASVAGGWGVTKETMMLTLFDFANGNYIRKRDGYETELYMGADNRRVDVRSTLYIVLFSDNMEIYVPKGKAVNIYVAGCRNVDVTCDGVAYIVNYGDCNINVLKGNREDVQIMKPSAIKSSWMFKKEK